MKRSDTIVNTVNSILQLVFSLSELNVMTIANCTGE